MLTSRKLDTTICMLVFAMLMMAYWITMPRVVTFEDAGLFLQVCYFNGIAHPPGYPLFTLLCVPWFWLPVDPVILGNSLSAIFASLTCIVLYCVLRKLGVNPPVAATTSLLLGLSREFWSQATIVEVYSLNALLLSLEVYLVICFAVKPQRWQLFAMSFVLGLGLSNHWPLVLLSCPGLVLVCLARMDALGKLLRSPGNCLISMMCLIVGLLPYLSLLLKSDPFFSYSGSIDTFAEFVAYVMREVYHGVDQNPHADFTDKLRFAGWLAQQSLLQFGYGFFLFACLGLFRRPRISGYVVAGLLLIFLGNTVALIGLLGFDFDFIHQGVFRPYPLVAWFCISIWLGLGLQWFTEVVVRKIIPVLVFSVMATAMLAENWLVNDRSEDRLAHDYASVLLESLEPGSNLLITSDPQVGPVSYLHQVVGLRADVTLYEAGNLFFPDKLIGETRQEKQSFVRQLIPASSVGISWLSEGEDYGLFLKHGPELAGYKLVPGMQDFVTRLVEEYLSGQIGDPNTLYFAHQLLIALGNHLTHYVFTNPAGQVATQMFRSVGRTFPGTLAILSTSNNNPQYSMPDNLLLELALPFDGAFGVETEDHEVAAYYYFLALLLANPDDSLGKNEGLALLYLNKGLLVMPGPDNPGLNLYRMLSASD